MFIDCEKEIFVFVVCGLLNVEIVGWEYLSEVMVKMYISCIFIKFGLCDWV